MKITRNGVGSSWAENIQKRPLDCISGSKCSPGLLWSCLFFVCLCFECILFLFSYVFVSVRVFVFFCCLLCGVGGVVFVFCSVLGFCVFFCFCFLLCCVVFVCLLFLFFLFFCGLFVVLVVFVFVLLFLF